MPNIDTLNTQLSAVGDAIRAKLSSQDTYKISEMPTAISSITTGGTIESKTITANGTYTAPEGVDGYNPVVVNVSSLAIPPWKNLSGDLKEYFVGNAQIFRGNGVNLDFILKTIESTSDITGIGGMFYNANLPKTFNYIIPFTFNFKSGSKIGFGNQFFFPNDVGKLTLTFNTNNNLLGSDNETINIGFNNPNLVEFPSALTNMTLNPAIRSISGPHGMSCLLSFPVDWIQNYLDNTTNYSNFLYSSNRYDEFYSMKDIVVPVNHKATWTSNYLASIGDKCYNARHLRWNTQNGTPYTVSWTNQVLNLCRYVGYSNGQMPNYLGTWASEFGSGYRITDSSTYDLYKNEDTAWTSLLAYSFYNHDSAVETINSLPDTSAYIATQGGTNTIQFKGDSGASTDAGAISNLTSAEIAVATNKGWTVTLL